VCGAGLTYTPTHWPLPSDTAAKKRARNGACFPVAMATPGVKQHFLQGMALSLCEMLPGCSGQGPGQCPPPPPWLLLETSGLMAWCGAGGEWGNCLWRLVGMEGSQAAAPLPPTSTCLHCDPTQWALLCGRWFTLKIPTKSKNPKLLTPHRA